MDKEEIRKAASAMGRLGGLKSRRVLTKEQAQAMAKKSAEAKKRRKKSGE